MKSLSQMTAKYVGRPFSSCSCMELAYNWYQDLGIEVPDQYKDLALNNFFAKWEQDKKGTINKMLELFKTLGRPADISNLCRHDLLAVNEKNNIYAAIALSASTAITSNISQGVRVFMLGELHRVVLARRLI